MACQQQQSRPSIRFAICIFLIAFIAQHTAADYSAAEYDEDAVIALTPQVKLPGGKFWFGSQLAVAGGKLMPANAGLEGAKPRKKATVK